MRRRKHLRRQLPTRQVGRQGLSRNTSRRSGRDGGGSEKWEGGHSKEEGEEGKQGEEGKEKEEEAELDRYIES